MSKRIIEVSRPIAEMVKGSLEYEMDAVRRAFYAQFPGERQDGMLVAPTRYSVVETFPDAAIVVEWEHAEPDEFYRAAYTRDAEGEIVFAPKDAWEPVELAYQPSREMAPEEPAVMGDSQPPAPVVTETLKPMRKGGKKLEQRAGVVALLESAGDGPRQIKAIGITAGVVNGNRRRYAAEVLRAAVAELRNHLHESAGQGRLLNLLGEAEHPETKGAGRPNLRETVVKWDDVTFNEATQQVDLQGRIIETASGKDILALIAGGVMPGVSQRGRGYARTVEENGERIEEVTDLTITGYDLVLEPSDPYAGVTLAESDDATAAGEPAQPQEDEMTPEQLAEMIRSNPDLLKGLVADEVKNMSEAQLKATEAMIRKALSLDESADVAQALAAAAAAQKKLAATEKQAALDAAISEACKTLPYGDALNKLFAESLKAAKLDTPEQVKLLAEAKRKEYDSIVAAARLASMGRVDVTGPVLETQTNGDWPDYARHSFEFTEALVRRGEVKAWSPTKPLNHNQKVAAQVLERFDALYKSDLAREAKLFAEAETAAGLSLPYGVSRAILGAVWPTLVATGLFDVGVVDQAPVYIYYEEFAEESGKHVAITNEDVVADLDDWVAMAHKRIQPGTVVVTANGDPSTVYVEGTGYIIDYTNGNFMAITGGGISNGATVDVDYHYDSIREGEGSAIQEGKATLSRALMDIQADRLATQINNEAIVFSRSQLGWDATARTLMMLVNEVRRRIDADIMYDALSAALGVATNSGGTWTAATDPIINFVSYLGVAKDKIAKRYYEPTGILLSSTRADAVANWDGFTAAGKRPDADLNVNGYIGRLKGLPVFSSTEFSDSFGLVFNRQHVFHRVYEPMSLQGPFQTYSGGKLVDAQQWFAREYNGTLIPVRSKAAYVAIS